MKKIIILGASGYVGQRLVKKLLEDENVTKNYQLILMNKNKRKLDYFKKYPNVIISDISIEEKNKERLIRTFNNAEVLYNLVHIMNKRDFLKKEEQFNNLIGEVSEKAKVKHIVFLGGLGDKNNKKSLHLRSRIQAGEILRKYKTPVTEFKASFIVGAGNLPFEILQRISAFLLFVVKPKHEKKLSPAFIDNVVNYLYKSFKYPDIFQNKILEIGCGEYTYTDLIIETKEILNKKKPFVITINDTLYTFFIKSKLAAYLVSLISGHNYILISNMLELVLYDTTRRDKYKIEKQIPKELLEPQYSLSEMIKMAINRIKKGEFLSLWDYPTAISRLSKKSKLELKDNYVIKEVMDTINKKYVKYLWREIKNIDCHVKEECWTKNIIWKFRGLFNKMIGGVNYKQKHYNLKEGLKVGDVLGFWQVDNIVDNEDIKELRLVALLDSPGTEYIQFVLKKVDDEDYALIIRDIYTLESFWSYIHYYLWYPFYEPVLNKIKEKLFYYSKKMYIVEKISKRFDKLK